MPRITDFATEMSDSGLTVIILNHATSLTVIQDTQVIAWSSRESFLDMDEDEHLGQDEVNGPLPVAARYRFGNGTVAVVSDPSIIISSMVDRDDNYQFIEYLTTRNGEQDDILVDRSHLSKTPLDISKSRLIDVREILSSPYALVGITALVFAVVSRYTLQKGESNG